MTLGLTSLVVGWAPVVPWLLAPLSILSGGLVKPSLHLVQRPFGIHALVYSLPEVGLLFVEKLWIAAYCLGLMGEGVNNTKLC